MDNLKNAIFSAFLAFIFYVGFVLLTIETVLVAEGKPPITSIIRNGAATHPVHFVVVGWVVGVLVGHLFWGTGIGLSAPAARPLHPRSWGSR